MDGAGIIDHAIEVIHSPLPGEMPVFLRNLTIRGCKVAAVLDSVEPEVHSVDIIQCAIEGAIILAPSATANETIRVQPKSGDSYKITKSGKINIEPFAPTIWGNGKGLKGEYFNGNDFTDAAVTRTDSNISFSEWSVGVHYAIKNNKYSVRWTGKIQPQYSENYIFSFSAGGGYKLWIDNKLVSSLWQDLFPETYEAAPIALEAGQLYDIKIEYFNTDARSGVGLQWRSKSLPKEYVPQSQLYSDAVVVPGPGGGNPDPDPNPGESPAQFVATIAREYIEIKSRENSFFQLFDSSGRLLRKGRISSGANYIYIPEIAKGILFLSIIKSENNNSGNNNSSEIIILKNHIESLNYRGT